MDGLLAARPKDLGTYAAVQQSLNQSVAPGATRPRSIFEEPAIIEFDFKDIYKTFAVSAQEVFEQVERKFSSQESLRRALEVQRLDTATAFADTVVSSLAQTLPAADDDDSAGRKEAFEKAREALAVGFENARAKLNDLGALRSPENREAFDQAKTETEEKFSQLEEGASTIIQPAP